jgi:hypothetical protein
MISEIYVHVTSTMVLHELDLKNDSIETIRNKVNLENKKEYTYEEIEKIIVYLMEIYYNADKILE